MHAGSRVLSYSERTRGAFYSVVRGYSDMLATGYPSHEQVVFYRNGDSASQEEQNMLA